MERSMLHDVHVHPLEWKRWSMRTGNALLENVKPGPVPASR